MEASASLGFVVGVRSVRAAVGRIARVVGEALSWVFLAFTSSTEDFLCDWADEEDPGLAAGLSAAEPASRTCPRELRLGRFGDEGD